MWSRFVALVLVGFSCAVLPARAQTESAAALAVRFADGIRSFNDGQDEEARAAFAEVVAADPQDGNWLYWLGLAELRLGRADEARTHIEASLRRGPSLQVDPLWVHHDLGQAQLAAGDADEAERTLHQVVMAVEERAATQRRDETELRDLLARSAAAGGELGAAELDAEEKIAQLELDQALLRRALARWANALEALGRNEDAERARGRAIALGGEPEAAAVVTPPWTGEPDLEEALRPWEARVGLSTLGDSNPSQLSERLALDTPDAGIQLISGESSDTASALNLRLGARRRAGDWELGATLEAQQSFYQDFDFLNMGDLSIAGHLARGRSPHGFLFGPLGSARVPAGTSRWAFLLQGGGDLFTVDTGSYLRIAEGSASFVFQPISAAASQVDIHLINRSFTEEPATGRRSGTEVRVRLGQSFFLGRDGRLLRFEALAGRRDAGLPFEGSLWRGSAELDLPVGNRLFVSLLGSWQRDDYDHSESDLFFRPFDPLHPEFNELTAKGTLREDTTLRAAASLSWETRPGLALVGRAVWIDRDSNLVDRTSLVDLDYQRTLASLGVEWSFR